MSNLVGIWANGTDQYRGIKMVLGALGFPDVGQYEIMGDCPSV